jgi:hypothetical protein
MSIGFLLTISAILFIKFSILDAGYWILDNPIKTPLQISYRASRIEDPASVPNVKKTNIELNCDKIVLLSDYKERINHELPSNGANQTTF